VQTNNKPWWAQATALVSVTASGAVTGLTFAPGTPADLAGPTSVPVHLLALEKSATENPATQHNANSDTALRAAIVNVARHYLRLSQTRTPAEMEALIWGADSVDGADHGPSCAAFASLTLELGAQAVGQQSWVSGGGTYPWPLHDWADVRVDPNPASPQVISVLQDAQSHDRWHPLGDGYQPRPGDWVLFDGHVEVVTGDSGGTLETIGGDSLPNYSVNAHTYTGTLSDYGIAGFVDNGNLTASARTPAQHTIDKPKPDSKQRKSAAHTQATVGGVSNSALGVATPAAAPVSGARTDPTAAHHQEVSRTPDHTQHRATPAARKTPAVDTAAIPGADVGQPGVSQPGVSQGNVSQPQVAQSQVAQPQVAQPQVAQPQVAPPEQPSQPAAAQPQHHMAAHHTATHHTATNHPGTASMPTASAQHAFIAEVAPGAIATQHEYGVPAAVTIAQAIDESGWGQSELAVTAHNLFGIKGTGPAGSVTMPTTEFVNGAWVSTTASFRAYHNFAESIADHGRLLATDSAYQHAMADRSIPDAFAADLAGVYATNPGYGGQLVAIMRLYDLYRFDVASPAIHHAPTAAAAAAPRTSNPTIPGAGASGVVMAPAPAPDSHAAARTAAPVINPAPTSPANTNRGGGTSIPGTPTATTTRVVKPYRHRIPLPVATAILTSAKVPLTRNEPLYQDVAELAGVPWELLAACDWLQCEAKTGYSPVHGEKLGKSNMDGTAYHTKSEALGQCAADLIGLSRAVYGIDITRSDPLSVHDLANVFAAFRWGGLLRRNGISAMEFPYSVAGLTTEHMRMCWPRIAGANAPDKPGTRFRGAFGAVPLLLSLKYPATI
jgi:flagellum-specific peptidoglycan hydrolase FlgJ